MNWVELAFDMIFEEKENAGLITKSMSPCVILSYTWHPMHPPRSFTHKAGCRNRKQQYSLWRLKAGQYRCQFKRLTNKISYVYMSMNGKTALTKGWKYRFDLLHKAICDVLNVAEKKSVNVKIQTIIVFTRIHCSESTPLAKPEPIQHRAGGWQHDGWRPNVLTVQQEIAESPLCQTVLKLTQ